MIRVRNIARLTDDDLAHLATYFSLPPERALVTNRRKNQYVFEATLNGSALIVKQYLHRTLQHRLASLLGFGNAERYCSAAHFLSAAGILTPTPLAILKRFRGPLPVETLFVMRRVEGRMLSTMLAELEQNPERSQVLAKKIAGIIAALRENGVVHRDLNTKNFLIAEDDTVTVIDFDAASRHAKRNRQLARRHARDVNTFLSTCTAGPRFAEAVATHLRSISPADSAPVNR